MSDTNSEIQHEYKLDGSACYISPLPLLNLGPVIYRLRVAFDLRLRACAQKPLVCLYYKGLSDEIIDIQIYFSLSYISKT